MKAEKIRKFIKCSFPKQPPLLLTLNSEMTKIYVETLNEELDELERLAEIGRATEKVFEKGFLVHDHFYQLPDTESLLNWYRAKE